MEADIKKSPKNADILNACDFIRGSVKALLLEQQGIPYDIAVTNYGYKGSSISCVLKYMHEGNIGTQLIYIKKGVDGIYMVYVIDNSTESNELTDNLTSIDYLQSVADQYNLEPPQKIDEHTIFVGITVKPAELVYKYEIIKIKNDKRSLKEFLSLQTSHLTKYVCSTPETKLLIDNGVKFTYAYYDDSNNFYGSVEITQSCCK